MIVDRPILLRKFRWGMALALFVAFVGRAGAGESSDTTNSVKKSEGVLSEGQKQPSRFFRPYRPGETISGSDIFNPKSFPTAPVHAPSPPSSKRNDELLDRQRNWIFLSGDEKKTDETKEALGVQESSLEPRKSVITRFLENKPAGDSKTNLGETSEVTPSLSSQPLTSGLNSSVNTEPQNDPRRNSSLQPVPLERNLGSPAAERARYSDLWRERIGVNASQAREEKEAQSKAFLELFNSRTRVPTGVGIAGLSEQNNFGVQLVTPGERGYDRATAPVGPGGIPTSLDPFREAPRRPLGGASVLSEPAFSSKAFGSVPAPVLRQEQVKPVAQPAVLPFPKRVF